MDTPGFAQEFDRAYRELYHRAVRRVDDARDEPSAETSALLAHLAQAGPMTLSDMARHFDRALSTLSAKVTALEAEGLLARQRDGDDARRALIWLSPAGRNALARAQQVLDVGRLQHAAVQLSAAQREQLLSGLKALVAALAVPASKEVPSAHEPSHSPLPQELP